MAVTLDPSEKDSGPKDEKKKHGHKQGVPELIFGDLWEYDPAPETADPRLRSRYDLFIGGRFIAPQAGEYFASINPATEETVTEIAVASAADVGPAVPHELVWWRQWQLCLAAAACACPAQTAQPDHVRLLRWRVCVVSAATQSAAVSAAAATDVAADAWPPATHARDHRRDQDLDQLRIRHSEWP